MNFRIVIFIFIIAVITGNLAFADEAFEIDQLPKKGNVTVEGFIYEIRNDTEFTLMDRTGSIQVNISEPLEFSVLDKIIVVGDMNTGIFSKDINAVSIVKNTKQTKTDVKHAPRASKRKTVPPKSKYDLLPNSFINRRGDRVFKSTALPADLDYQFQKMQREN